jgi:hypothetical protein
MYGSCCEEQEAKEAAARSRIKAATLVNEKRMMQGHLLREKIRSQLRCECAGCACGDCNEDEEELEEDGGVKVPATADSSDDDFASDDEDELAMITRLRQARLDQIRTEAQAATRKFQARGSHARLGEGKSVAALLSDPTDDSPIVLHLAAGGDDSDALLWVEDALKKAARELPFARLVTAICAGNEPPECLSFIGRLPALLVVERGLVSSVCTTLAVAREPEAVHKAVTGWLEVERRRLAVAVASANGDAEDSDGEEEGVGSYCGIPGCKPYFHEHVGRNRAGADRTAAAGGPLFG